MSKPKNKRIKVVGIINVFRDGYGKEYLAADFVSNDKKVSHYYYPAPKSFHAVIGDGFRNSVEVEMTVNEDGSNPRSVKRIGEPFH